MVVLQARKRLSGSSKSPVVAKRDGTFTLHNGPHSVLIERQP
jgi:hypothetical protein